MKDAVYGYVLIDGELWLVTMQVNKTRRSVKRRSKGAASEHLADVQAFLEDRDNCWLVDRLRCGERVYVPLGHRDDPAPPAAHGG
jgi:hypothetical protein